MSFLRLCVDAYNDHIIKHDYDIADDEAPMRAVLRALASEINAKYQGLSGHQIALILSTAGAEQPHESCSFNHRSIQ